MKNLEKMTKAELAKFALALMQEQEQQEKQVVTFRAYRWGKRKEKTGFGFAVPGFNRYNPNPAMVKELQTITAAQLESAEKLASFYCLPHNADAVIFQLDELEDEAAKAEKEAKRD